MYQGGPMDKPIGGVNNPPKGTTVHSNKIKTSIDFCQGHQLK